MFEDVEDALRLLRPMVAKLEADALDGAEAARLVEFFAEGEKLCAAGRAVVTRRVEKTDLWRREGFRSAAAWMAPKAGMPLGQAIGSLEMARHLDELPAMAEAFRDGRISEAQAREISAASAEGIITRSPTLATGTAAGRAAGSGSHPTSPRTLRAFRLDGKPVDRAMLHHDRVRWESPVLVLLLTVMVGAGRRAPRGLPPTGPATSPWEHHHEL